MQPRTFKYTVCLDCLEKHYVEIHPDGRETCHGPDYDPTHQPGYYTRSIGRCIQLIPLCPPAPAPDAHLEASYEDRTDYGDTND